MGKNYESARFLEGLLQEEPAVFWIRDVYPGSWIRNFLSRIQRQEDIGSRIRIRNEEFKQCCGSGSGIRFLFAPFWIRNTENQIGILQWRNRNRNLITALSGTRTVINYGSGSVIK
jgi:hypothetical protein